MTMKKLITAALFMLLSSAIVPLPAHSTVSQTPEEVLLIKKKKKAEIATETAKKKVGQKTAKKRDCGTFMQCLFGKPQGGSPQYASLQDKGVSRKSKRRIVDWDEAKYAPGTLIVRTPERALYYVLEDGEAVRYSIGVGREGFQWSGSSRIVAKQEWPDWRPPAEMIKREAAKGRTLPAMMEGGPGNPLGARAMYIGGTIYRVHGTNDERSIGKAMSSGCIRMMNADVIDLFERVKVGSRIYVYQ
jgi:lipoprotein-anchoring transpeptidase ErfK/SrfK